MTKFFCFLLLGFQSVTGLWAQVDTILLPSVQVKAVSIRDGGTGGRTDQLDSLEVPRVSTNLADLLSQHSGLFIKGYGLGSLGTSSIRGGSAGHTAVIWNGFTIASPMLGQLDFSLLPTSFFDEVGLSYGGNTAGWGNGSVSGMITLNSQAEYNQGIHLQSQSGMGSFGRKSQQLKLKLSHNRIVSQTRLFFEEAENDYPFQIRPNLPKQRQSNFALNQKGLLQEFYWKFSQKDQLAFHFWLQDSYREIPPQTTQDQNLSNQTDEIFRATIHWKNIGNRVITQFRGGFFMEQIDFRDDLIQLQAPSQFKTLITELEQDWAIHQNIQLQWGINHTSTTAEATGYPAAASETRTALFGSILYSRRNWNYQFSFRQALLEDNFLPITPLVAIEHSPKNWLKIKAKASRDYRHPTLNDRFWSPGGNPELLAEQGWSQEVGIHFSSIRPKTTFQFSLTTFNRNVENWIRWLPQEEITLPWSPRNIAKVWSRGIEQRFKGVYRFKNSTLQIQSGHDLIYSTNQVTVRELNLIKGEQLDYIPKQQAFAMLRYQWHRSSISYRHTFTGPITTIVEPLNGYQVGNLIISQSIRWKKTQGTFFLKIENIWNKNYRVVERRIMPGRHFRAGINLDFKAPLKSTKKQNQIFDSP